MAHSSFKCKNPQPSSIVHYKAREPGLSRGPVQHISQILEKESRGLGLARERKEKERGAKNTVCRFLKKKKKLFTVHVDCKQSLMKSGRVKVCARRRQRLSLCLEHEYELLNCYCRCCRCCVKNKKKKEGTAPFCLCRIYCIRVVFHRAKEELRLRPATAGVRAVAVVMMWQVCYSQGTLCTFFFFDCL